MSNEQIAHDLAMLVMEQMLKDNKIEISQNPQVTSTAICQNYSLYKNNCLNYLNKLN